jgi:uncharacterized membrane protein YbhN (UPF0104 family)
MKLFLRLVLLAAGVALFAAYASRLDLRGMGGVFRDLGGWLPALLLPFFVVYVVDAAAWSCAFARGAPTRFWRTFRIRWAGEAVSNVIPSGYLGGEVVKVHLLRRSGASGKEATSSTVVSKTAQSAAQLMFVAAGSLVFLRIAPDDPAWRFALGCFFVAALAALAAFFWLQTRGLFGTLLGAAGWTRWTRGWVARWRPVAEQTDAVTRHFYANHRGRFFGSTALYLLGWLLDTVEIFAFAWLSGSSISWPEALVIEAFTGIAKAVGWFIPGSAGIQESGIVWVGRIAGLPDPVCVAYALFRRGREFIYAAAGWGLLATEQGGRQLVRGARSASDPARLEKETVGG